MGNLEKTKGNKRSTQAIPLPRFRRGDIVLAPRWPFGRGRILVIAEIIDREYIYSGKRYENDGYSAGWRYQVQRGRKKL